MAALAYARRGWHVFPVHSVRTATDGTRSCSCGKSGCENSGKHPRTAHGLKDATVDENQIRAWWDKWPDANVGIRTGKESGMFVLDIDPKHDGENTLARLVAEHGPLPENVEAKSGGGGRHFYFQHPGSAIKTRANCEPGIDIRADGGYIVADANTPQTTPLMLRGIRAGCQLTGLGERSVWSLINRNALPHRRVGRAVMFVPQEVEAWVAAGCPTAAGAADRIRKEMRA